MEKVASNTARREGQAMIHLNFDARAPHIGHPQTVMKWLGISYKIAVPQSIYDSWWFFGCENVPDPLPNCLSVLKFQPADAIGHGLTAEDVARLEKGTP
jgi:hypothetical protein